MPVSGLVLTVNDDVADALRATLGTWDGLVLGDRVGARIAATLESDDSMHHDEALRRLRSEPGVTFVDLVFHDFEDVLIAPSALVMPRERGARHGAP